MTKITSEKKIHSKITFSPHLYVLQSLAAMVCFLVTQICVSVLCYQSATHHGLVLILLRHLDAKRRCMETKQIHHNISITSVEIHLFKGNNRNTETIWKICLKLRHQKDINDVTSFWCLHC